MRAQSLTSWLDRQATTTDFLPTQLSHRGSHPAIYLLELMESLYFTTVPEDTDVPLAGFKRVEVKRLRLEGDEFPFRAQGLEVVREPSNMANGMTLVREGRLVICEQGTKTTPARISRMDLETGEVGPWSNSGVVCGSTRPTTSSSRATARSGSPTPATGLCRVSRKRRCSAISSTATIRRPTGLRWLPIRSKMAKLRAAGA